MSESGPGWRILTWTLVLSALACAGLGLYHAGRLASPVAATDTLATGSEPAPAQVVVHIAGAVKTPGVYRLPADARVLDALRAAGGQRDDARLDEVNLAARVRDGLRLYVPTTEEHKEQVIIETEDIYVHGPPRQDPSPAAPPVEPDTLAVGSAVRSESHSEHTSQRKELPTAAIDLNHASTSELQRLPGVGPAMAARIVAYRETHGRFALPEDLMAVKGIGPKSFEKLKLYVTVR